jgi:hypothetical protein
LIAARIRASTGRGAKQAEVVPRRERAECRWSGAARTAASDLTGLVPEQHEH